MKLNPQVFLQKLPFPSFYAQITNLTLPVKNMCEYKLVVPGGAGITASVWPTARQPACLLPFQKKQRNDKWAFGFYLILNPLILFLNHQSSRRWKEEKLKPPMCMCTWVRVFFLVNRALIALALQLGDFLSKRKSGANKEYIFKVLKCVIIFLFFSNWLFCIINGLTE